MPWTPAHYRAATYVAAHVAGNAYMGYKAGRILKTGFKAPRRTARAAVGADNAVDNKRVGFAKPGRAYPKAASFKAKANVAYQLATNVEKKYVITDQKVTFNAITAAPIVGNTGCILMNGMLRGNSVQTRIGDKVRFKSVRGAVTLFNVTDAASQVRVMIVRYRHGNGLAIKSAQATASVAASLGYLFQTTATNTVQPFSQYNFNSTDMSRFDIIMDRSVVVGTASGNAYPMMRFNIPVDFTTNYKLGNDGVITDIDDGAVYLLIWGDDVSTTAGWDLCMDFTDI